MVYHKKTTQNNIGNTIIQIMVNKLATNTKKVKLYPNESKPTPSTPLSYVPVFKNEHTDDKQLVTHSVECSQSYQITSKTKAHRLHIIIYS